MRCKIDDGTLEYFEQSGYVDKWKCRRCRVVWELAPKGDVDTDGKIVAELMQQKVAELNRLHKQNRGEIL